MFVKILSMTRVEEDYIKNIYYLEEEKEGMVTTNSIAKTMKIKASSASDMIQRLMTKGMVNYKKYQGVTLTIKGKQQALNLIKKHRLWETFLSVKLNFSWEEVHDLAEQLEHIQSEELTNKLNDFLDYPMFDPHGEPIPGNYKGIKTKKQWKLSKVNVAQEYIIESIKKPDKTFLEYLNKINLKIGSVIFVRNIETYNNSMEIELENKNYFLTKEVTENIYVILKENHIK